MKGFTQSDLHNFKPTPTFIFQLMEEEQTVDASQTEEILKDLHNQKLSMFKQRAVHLNAVHNKLAGQKATLESHIHNSALTNDLKSQFADRITNLNQQMEKLKVLIMEIYKRYTASGGKENIAEFTTPTES